MTEKEVQFSNTFMGDLKREIPNGVKNCKKMILSLHEANSFLNERSLKKPNEIRALAWLYNLKIVKSNIKEELANELVQLCEDYQRIIYNISCQAHFVSFLDSVPKDKGIIEADVNRSLHWFYGLVKDAGLKKDEEFPQDNESKELDNDSKNRIERILAVLSYSHNFQYIQGYDRYAYITYLLGYILAKSLNLVNRYNFAEAISLNLTCHILRILDLPSILDEPNTTNKHYNEIDQLIAVANQQMARELTNYHNSAIHFALKWEILWFAEEHDFPEIVLLWDHILLNKRIYHNYFNSLVIAHLQQVKRPPNSSQHLIEIIQNYKDWDTIQLIQSADKLAGIKSIYISPTVLALILLLIVIIVLYLLQNQQLLSDIINSFKSVNGGHQIPNEQDL